MSTSIKLKKGTTGVVLSVIKEEYIAQSTAHNLLISNTQTLTSIAGFVFTGHFAIIFFNYGLLKQGWLLTLNVGALVSLLTSINLCFDILKSRSFDRMGVEHIATQNVMATSATNIRSRLVHSYEAAIRDNDVVFRDLFHIFDCAVVAMRISLFLCFFSLVSIGVSYMTKTNQEKPRQQTTSTSDGSRPDQPFPREKTQRNDVSADGRETKVVREKGKEERNGK